MKLSKLLYKEYIRLNLQDKPKEQLIEDLVDIFFINNAIKPLYRERVITAVINREHLGSTGLEHGIAVPHAKTGAVSELTMALGISKTGIPFDSFDGSPTHLFFLLLAPPQITGPHLKTLEGIARITKDDTTRFDLINARTPEEVVSIILKADQKG
ncbi:PTS sugar transporter subunit IIA [Chlamydiota bacterium]